MKTEKIDLGHGEGGRLTHELINHLFKHHFSNTYLDPLCDAAVLPDPNGRLAFTTDSYVVQPIFFPGGDIGKLAVCGTINDLSMVGAMPLYLTAGYILEEGMPYADLERIVTSMAKTAADSGDRRSSPVTRRWLAGGARTGSSSTRQGSDGYRMKWTSLPERSGPAT